MKVVVTGAAGFIGSHLTERLLTDGHEVIGIDAFTAFYERSRKEDNLRSALASPRFRLVEADLRTDDLDGPLAGADCVVHEAAMAGLPLSWSDIDGYATCNVVGTARLLDAAARASVPRFVHISTSSVYGRNAVGDEESACEPISPYGITKLAAEHLVHAYARAHGLPAVILRYFSVYGPRQRPDMAYHIFIERLRRGLPITIFGDGTQTRSNTYVSDCVEGTVLAMDRGVPGETYNIGGGTVLALTEVIDMMAEQLGVDAQLDFAPPRLGDQLHTVAHLARAKRVLGYRPQVEPAAGLAAQIRWHTDAIPV